MILGCGIIQPSIFPTKTKATQRAGLSPPQDKTISEPKVISRDQHNVSRANISRSALKVLYTLKDAGFESHLVGGGVRDLLLDMQPKDFDVATNASPEQVKEVFGRQCRLIGRRFRLAHVRYGPELIEVSTYRSSASEAEAHEDAEFDGDSGRILRDNVYGNIEQDAFRRDFTANALYYNIRDFSIIDYADGVADVRDRVLRLIGDPETRYREDPVRMLRAVRLATKLDFSIHPQTEAPIFELGDLLRDVPAARMFEEVRKMFLSPTALACFEGLRHYDLFGYLFPETERALSDDQEGFALPMLVKALTNTEDRIRADKPVTPAFLLAAMLWEPVRLAMRQHKDNGIPPSPALFRAADQVIEKQQRCISLPRRYTTPMKEIWHLQTRLPRRRGKQPYKLAAHPRFRAAYDFLLLRAEVGECDQELADWWTQFQEDNADQIVVAPHASDDARPAGNKRRRRRRRRGGKASGSGGSSE